MYCDCPNYLIFLKIYFLKSNLFHLASHFVKLLNTKLFKYFSILTKYSILLMNQPFELFTLKIYFS